MSASQPNRVATEGEDRRKTKRYPLDEQQPITATSGGRHYTCRILDVSIDGVRLHFDRDIPAGNVVALEHPAAGTLCGVCVWRDSNSMGVELQFPKRELERLLKCICLVL